MLDVAAPEAFFQGGIDSFLEDWLETGDQKRTSHLRGAWRRDLKGQWHAPEKARYSVNSWDLVEGKRSFQMRTRWNGGVAKDETGPFFFMTAGGSDTTPTTENPSTLTIPRPHESRTSYPRLEIDSFDVRRSRRS